MYEDVVIEKLVHGGQGLGVLADGRKVFVWNALPGEKVRVRLTKRKKDYAEGVAEEVITPSDVRLQPADEAYLSTSPWQIMTFAAENTYKKEILQETFQRAGVELPDFTFMTAGDERHYRNKMEYSFWADDDGLHLALFHRASHGKRIVKGSSIARPEIDAAANRILDVLNKHSIRGSQLKTVVLRVSAGGDVAAALYVKDQTFPKLGELQDVCNGIIVYFSEPRSPVSVPTKKLYDFGKAQLTDSILGVPISYGVTSFFQVNLPIFSVAAGRIKDMVNNAADVVDIYSGVGTIGIPVGAKTLVESDEHNIDMARHNAGPDIRVVHAAAEAALDFITAQATIIFDPPRAGLHQDVIRRIQENKPKRLIYLSCNPVTQARDIALLAENYEIETFEGYNFFPRTPHIESLASLRLKP